MQISRAVHYSGNSVLKFNTKVRLPERYQAMFSEAVRTQNRVAIRRATDRAAVDSVISALEPLINNHIIEEMSQNHPGYDILIDKKVRIQIKGSTYLDYYSGMFRNFDFDIAIVVALGICIRDRHHYSNKFPYSDFIGFFVFPREIVQNNVYRGGHALGLYAKKEPILNSRPSHNGYRFLDFASYKDRFDLIGELITPLPV